MSASKFSTPYQKVTKENGQPLDASDWNAISEAVENAQTKINEVIDNIDNIPSGSGGGSSSGGGTTPTGVVSVSSKGNTTISSTKHLNIEPGYVADGGSGTYGDVQVKPGDDITLESHHRASDKRDEITIKTSDGIDGSKAPVKMQIIASNMTFSTKGKVVPAGSKDSPEVMNINATTGNGKAYLKVRARAIDLRCEEHGGIALQPKGTDSNGHMNKIKFEHGGGDGLEFGTFNAEKTSIFTDEYRFKKDGVWKMATRHTEVSDKFDENDATTANKYVKPTDDNISELVDEPSNYEEPDDFYDLINTADEQCTTRDIIRTAHAMNGTGGIHTKITDKGNLEIETEVILVVDSSATAKSDLGTLQTSGTGTIDFSKGYMSLADFLTCFGSSDASTINAAFSAIESGEALSVTIPSHSGTSSITLVLKKIARSINIESAAGIKLKGILDFGSTFNFGETDNGIEFLYKKTKKNATKDCSILKVVAVNNSSTNLVINGQSIAPGTSGVVAEASTIDVINVTNSFKNIDTNNVKDVVNLFTLNGMKIQGKNIVCEEPVYIVSMSQTASSMVQSGDLPNGANNWGGTYENMQFPDVMNDAFVVGDSFTESELATKLSTDSLPSIFTSVSSGGTVAFVVKNKADNLTWGVKLTKYGSNRSCTLADLTNIVEWMKTNKQGPWASQS